MDFSDFYIKYANDQSKFDREHIEAVDELRASSSALWNLLFHQQKLMKPPSKLAFISDAESHVLPNGMEFNYFVESQPQYYKGQNQYFSKFASIDWTFVLTYVISFICIAFSYSAFSGEKVKGTLKLMLSNPLSRSTLIVGKLIGISVCILIPLSVGILLNLLLVHLNPNIRLNASDYGHIALFLFAAVLFITFNILMGFIISCLTSRPIHSLNLVLILWIFLNIIIPSISWVAAKKMIDIPSQA